MVMEEGQAPAGDPENKSEAAKPAPPQDANLQIVPPDRPDQAKLDDLKQSLREARLNRTAPFRWKKGQTGNPGGRNGKTSPEIRDLCRAYTAEAVAGVVNMMRETRDERVRLDCYKWLVDRGWGKAPQLVGIVTPDDKPVVFTVKIGERGDGDEPGENGDGG